MDADKSSLVGIYGGTFDPIHFGHLRVAEELIDSINLQHIIFVPSGEPRLRNTPIGTRHQRTEMIRLAIQDNHQFSIDEREINRSGMSATVESLREYRSEWGRNAVLIFILGIDAFRKINEWHHWRELFDLCHIIVVPRPGYVSVDDHQNLPEEIKTELIARCVLDAKDLKLQTHGAIYTAQTSLLEISATQIRSLISTGRSIRYLLPENVSDYIKINHLYAGKT